MLGLAILLGFEFIGYMVHHFLRFPLPPGVIGLILLVLSLFRGWVKLKWIEQPAEFLLKHMMVFFAPTIVGVMIFFSRIGDEWIAISLSLIGSTLCVLLVTGWTITKLGGKGERQNNARRDG